MPFRAQVKQRGEAFFGVAEGVFPLTLVGDLTDHPDHSAASALVWRQAAVDFQPMEGAVGPLDAVAHRLFERLAGQHRMERADDFGAVSRGEQVEVIQVLGQGRARIVFDPESEQCQLMLKHDVPKALFD